MNVLNEILLKLPKQKIRLIFFVFLFIAGFIYALPSKFLLAVYSPSYLGLFLLFFLIPVILINSVLLSVVDFKERKIGSIVKRILIILLVFGLSLGVKYLYTFD